MKNVIKKGEVIATRWITSPLWHKYLYCGKVKTDNHTFYIVYDIEQKKLASYDKFYSCNREIRIIGEQTERRKRIAERRKQEWLKL